MNDDIVYDIWILLKEYLWSIEKNYILWRYKYHKINFDLIGCRFSIKQIYKGRVGYHRIKISKHWYSHKLLFSFDVRREYNNNDDLVDKTYINTYPDNIEILNNIKCYLETEFPNTISSDVKRQAILGFVSTISDKAISADKRETLLY